MGRWILHKDEEPEIGSQEQYMYKQLPLLFKEQDSGAFFGTMPRLSKPQFVPSFSLTLSSMLA